MCRPSAAMLGVCCAGGHNPVGCTLTLERRRSATMASAYRIITTRNEFHDALREAFAAMASSGCREVWLCDDDFADWPLNEPEVVEHLSAWALPHRKLTVLARTFEEVTRR